MNSPAPGSYDLIVVGLGAVGSAAVYHATRAGLRVLGIDRFNPPHEHGSSHAESRITRLAVGEGPQYLPFVARAHEIWRQLEAEADTTLLHQSGGYIITPPAPTRDTRWGAFVQRTAAVAADAGVDFELETPEQAMTRFPNLIVDAQASVGYEPTAGIVMCERAVDVQLQLAQQNGATLLTDTTVQNVRPDGSGVRVATRKATYTAAAAIVATGAWFPELASTEDAHAVTVTRQVVYWFEVDDPAAFDVARVPFVIWPGQDISEYSAVFPMASGGRPGLKLLGEQFRYTTTAATVDRRVNDREIHDFYERLVAPRIRGVRQRTVDASVCLYTNTHDDNFLIDTHPDASQLMFASPCSGHGFKHSTALAEAMVAQLSDGSGLGLSAFKRS